MGSGKTYVGAAVASYLKTPTLVVCPHIAQSAWKRAAEHFADRFSVIGIEKLRAGNTQFGCWSNYRPGTEYLKCTMCQCRLDPLHPIPCYAHPDGVHCVESKRTAPHYGKFEFHPGVKLVIFDEAHRFGGIDSLNGDIVIAAKQQNKKVLALSATLADNPLKMRALGYLLDLHNLNTDLFQVAHIGRRVALPSFYRWARSHGCIHDARFHGWKWLVGQERQREIMAAIRAQIFPARGVRLDYDDIPGFPERDIVAELYDLDDPEAVDSCYKEMAEALRQLDDKAANDKSPDGPLTRLLRARQRVELLKVPVAESLATDWLETGKSVGIFVNFRQTIDELKKRFPNSVIIDGSPDSIKNRDRYVEKFQANTCRLALINCEAGGVALSLADLDGQHPRAGLVFPGLSATSLRQLFGRFHRENGRSRCHYRVLFANKTVEMQTHRVVTPKLNNLDALNDGDLSPANLVFA